MSKATQKREPKMYVVKYTDSFNGDKYINSRHQNSNDANGALHQAMYDWLEAQRTCAPESLLAIQSIVYGCDLDEYGSQCSTVDFIVWIADHEDVEYVRYEVQACL